MADRGVFQALSPAVVGLAAAIAGLHGLQMRGPQGLELLGDAIAHLGRVQAGRARRELGQGAGHGGGVGQEGDGGEQGRGGRGHRQGVDHRGDHHDDDRGAAPGAGADHRGDDHRQGDLGGGDLHQAVGHRRGGEGVAGGVAGRGDRAAAGAAGGVDDVEAGAVGDGPGHDDVDVQARAHRRRPDRNDVSVVGGAENGGVDRAADGDVQGAGDVEGVGPEVEVVGFGLAGDQGVAADHIDGLQPAGRADRAVEDAVVVQRQGSGVGAGGIGDGRLHRLARADIDEAVAAEVHGRAGIAGEALVEVHRAGPGELEGGGIDRAVEGQRRRIGAAVDVEEGGPGGAHRADHRR